MSGRRRVRWPWVLPVLAVVAAVAVWLLLGSGGNGSEHPSGTTATGSRGTLDLKDTSAEAVAKMAAITVPTTATDFLTAKLGNERQLDVTFVMDKGDEAALVAGSGFPVPVTGKRVITHSSPLWKLNPEGTIRGTADSRNGVKRQLELVEEGGRTRVRLVITPSQ